MTRRELLVVASAFGCGAARAASPLKGMSMSGNELPAIAYVGCRTTRARGAIGRGLSVFDIDADGRWTEVQLIENMANPSFLAVDRRADFVYAVHGDMTDVTSLRREPDGRLAVIGTTGTGGANPVHLAPDPTNRFMLIANYATGSVAALPRDTDGSLAAPAALLTLPGHPGPDPVEQRSSHPHEVVWDPASRFVVVPDKGTDQIFVLRFDPDEARFEIGGRFATRPGSGPRHIAFPPQEPYAFVAYRVEDGERDLVAPRGGGARAGGRGPRFASFGLRSDRLLVANELSNDICAFDLASGGRPTRSPEPEIPTGSPVCILVLPR